MVAKGLFDKLKDKLQTFREQAGVLQYYTLQMFCIYDKNLRDTALLVVCF